MNVRSPKKHRRQVGGSWRLLASGGMDREGGGSSLRRDDLRRKRGGAVSRDRSYVIAGCGRGIRG